MIGLALKKIEEVKNKKLTKLDLGDCDLSYLPNELFDLTWLEDLTISSYGHISDYSTNNNNLHFKYKSLRYIKEIPQSIESLTNLKRLVAKGCFISGTFYGLTDIGSLKKLTNLESLDISFNNVTDFSSLQYLKNLRILNLSHTYITKLEIIKNLGGLKSLDISHTLIDDISPIREISSLTHLNLSNSYVINLEPLRDLKYLKELDISNTCSRMKEILPLDFGNIIIDMKSLKTLTELQLLNLNDTKIKNNIHFNELKNLEILNLKRSKISNIIFIENLNNLKQLDLSYNPINDIRPLKNIISAGLKLKTKETEDGEINIVGCPITNPPSYVVENGSDAIIRYWQEIENKETVTNNQTKLIFVGNTRVGKTSLWRFMKDNVYQESFDSTHGIKTIIWDNELLGKDNLNLSVHIWDFGGQEYYHATHRLFMSQNSVYILVWDIESNTQGRRLERFTLDDDTDGNIEEIELEHFPASYWLDNIRYYGGNSPVMIIQNKVDDESKLNFHTSGRMDLSNTYHLSIKNSYLFQKGQKNFEYFYNDFKKFKNNLLEKLRSNATQFKLIKYYTQVRERLEVLSKKSEFILLTELKKIALEFDETPDEQNLLSYLKNFTNTVLHFSQNDLLKDRLYLNPTHISYDIYKVLNKTVRDNNGHFDERHVQTRLICDNAEANRYLALMREFDLIFEKKTEEGNREFIAPQYLQPRHKLKRGEKLLIKMFQPVLYLRFKSFVPRSIMLRFIVQKGSDAFEDFYWQNGIVYQSIIPNKFIKVEYDPNNSIFCIEVQDKSVQFVDMQSIVEQFYEINDKNDEFIQISNDGKAYFNLRKIRTSQNQGRKEIDNEEGDYLLLNNFDWLIRKEGTGSQLSKSNVRDLVEKAKLKEALFEIKTWAHNHKDSHLEDQVSHLLLRLYKVDNDENLGLVGWEEASRERNKLSYSVLNLINEESIT